MTLLPTLTAVEYEKELGTGATKPCVFQCEDYKNKAAGEYVVKLRGMVRSNEIGLQYELLAWYLAEHLGIPHPAAALITIDPEVAATIERGDVRENVQKSVGLNFGTRYEAGFSSWVAGARVPASLEHTAAEIVAFDALIENPDRRVDKPNFLHKGDDVLVLDHELAFSFVMAIGVDLTEWNARRLNFLQNHVFYPGLKGKTLDLKSFTSRLQSLDDKMIEKICGSVPPAFGVVNGKIPAHLRAARDRAPAVMDVIQEIFK